MTDFISRASAVLESRAAVAERELRSPVDISDLLELEGVGDVLIERDPGRHGALRRVGNLEHPVVYRAYTGPSSLTPRERFTVAHEVAHAIVQRELGAGPSRRKEYWALEELCNAYAARALIPRSAVDVALARSSTASLMADSALMLSARCVVSRPAAFRRLVGVLEGSAAWGLVDTRGTTVVDWVAENPQVLGVRARSVVRPGTALWSAVPAAERLVNEDYYGEAGPNVPSLYRRVGAHAAVVVHLRERDYGQ